MALCFVNSHRQTIVPRAVTLSFQYRAGRLSRMAVCRYTGVIVPDGAVPSIPAQTAYRPGCFNPSRAVCGQFPGAVASIPGTDIISSRLSIVPNTEPDDCPGCCCAINPGTDVISSRLSIIPNTEPGNCPGWRCASSIVTDRLSSPAAASIRPRAVCGQFPGAVASAINTDRHSSRLFLSILTEPDDCPGWLSVDIPG